jgi:hypothetical protein
MHVDQAEQSRRRVLVPHRRRRCGGVLPSDGRLRLAIARRRFRNISLAQRLEIPHADALVCRASQEAIVER